ncbi:alpha/beta hydrolase [Psychrobacter sp. W2-37-MNA-CIBAN-0211]|uniref:alpha/beta hydrolase n=1 Tax=Psychrobacter sp. W2-37-MNA-CIBAN-0211 TaxID=3140443 RepID=UPI00331AE64A
MPILPVPSLNALLTKTLKTVKKTAAKNVHQHHVLHHTLKGLDNLPTPILERFNHQLKASTAEQYPLADGHLRLILAVSNKLKRPLALDKLPKLRQKFGTDAVSLQAPSVWQQNAEASGNSENAVSWQDKTIANADGGDMTVRCYQQSKQNNEGKSTDEVAMLFFHGGGFCIGDIDTHHEFCHTVCAQTGWAVVSVDYRMAPEYPAPTALKDCLAAYAWLTKHSQSLGALPSRIVLSGDSAGGCLAALVAQQVIKPIDALWQDNNQATETDKKANNTFKKSLADLPRPLAQLPLYPVTDYEAEYPSWELYGEGLLLDHNDANVFNTAYTQHSGLTQSHPLISVMQGDNTHLCPSYVVVAELDILRDEGLAYAELLQKEGVKVETYTVLGAPHGFINLMSVHQGLGNQTSYIIKSFACFVQNLLTSEGDEPNL